MLPKSVLKKISQICAHFFWKGNNTNSKGARVSWQTICYPKAEGGLGLKDVLSWNHACMLHHLRSIFAKAGSLWIAWLYAYVLKGRSVWQIEEPQNGNRCWRKILQLRDSARQFIVLENGVEVWNRTITSISNIWKELKPQKERVTWHRLVWSYLSIPKHDVITWMAILNRLPTMDRLMAWGIGVGGTCKLCLDEMESREHMFFGCLYSRSIWEVILTKCGIKRKIGSWTEKLEWAIQHLKGKSMKSTIMRIAWKAFIYCIWRERNNRVHNNASETAVQVFEPSKRLYVSKWRI